MQSQMGTQRVREYQYEMNRAFGLMRRGAVQRILLATDVSAGVDRALPFAIEIARRHGSTVYAMHVTGPDLYPFPPPSPWPMLDRDAAELRDKSKMRLDEELAGVSHEIIFQAGETWETISKFIEARKIDLLVFSAPGQNNATATLFGSVTAEILRKAQCPALTVGASVAGKPQQNAQLDRILYATDFGTESLAAAPYAVSLAEEHRAQLIVFHCIERRGDVSAMFHALRNLVPFGADLRCDPVCVVEHGAPSGKILEVAEGHAADLIVLGVHRERNSKEEGLMHPGVLRIATEAKCPVLTVRA